MGGGGAGVFPVCLCVCSFSSLLSFTSTSPVALNPPNCFPCLPLPKAVLFLTPSFLISLPFLFTLPLLLSPSPPVLVLLVYRKEEAREGVMNGKDRREKGGGG